MRPRVSTGLGPDRVVQTGDADAGGGPCGEAATAARFDLLDALAGLAAAARHLSDRGCPRRSCPARRPPRPGPRAARSCRRPARRRPRDRRLRAVAPAARDASARGPSRCSTPTASPSAPSSSRCATRPHEAPDLSRVAIRTEARYCCNRWGMARRTAKILIQTKHSEYVAPHDSWAGGAPRSGSDDVFVSARG